ncbi:MAG: tyrosine-type recombinase/integrase [Candidatus Pacebacteria bacterium]|nr:tyrosine-type recombinase/integrase [Candidatus Paceibacterota bacterium]
MPHNLKKLHREFLEYLEVEKGRSLKTVENYDRYLSKFLGFAKVSSPSQIDDETVRKYRLFLNREEKNSGGNLNKKTQNYYLIALRVFLKYLAKRNIASLPPERIELAKTPQRDLDLITAEELQRLLDVPLGGGKCVPLSLPAGKAGTVITGKPTEAKLSSASLSATSSNLRNLRDKAILELLFSTGLRVSELCALNRDSFSEAKNGEISIRGKGGKVRVVFISETAKQALKNYLDKRTDTEEALFVSAGTGKVGFRRIPRYDRSQGNQFPSSGNVSRLTPRSVERMIKQRATEAGISKKVTPHVIRHCFATDLLSNGADIRAVQTMLGHSNISTTQIYTHITDKQLRDVHKSFHNKGRK